MIIILVLVDLRLEKKDSNLYMVRRSSTFTVKWNYRIEINGDYTDK